MTDIPDTKTLASDAGNPFTAVPIDITVSVGRARPLVRDLVMLGPNAVLTLDKRVDDPVDL
ncbi:MAG: FliM/FliN family flagellar motor switch protein, partial [Pseudomonadota bacterium]